MKIKRVLTIECLPADTHGLNVRTMLSSEDWDLLRTHCYAEAGYECEICHGTGDKWPVECHEVWSYDLKKGVQTLVKLQALCPLCHGAKHIGRTTQVGNLEAVLAHHRKINRITRKTQEKVLKKVANDFWERDKVAFKKVDITYAKKLVRKLRQDLKDLSKLMVIRTQKID